MATGRGPVTTGLGAEEAGIKMDRGYVVVDEQFRTNVPDVSAIGDVITFGKPGHPQLAHLSTAEGIAAGGAPRRAGRSTPINYDHVPKCTYCDPEIGSVGLTEKQAKERGYDVRVGTFPFGVLGRARIADETDGFVKIVAEKKYDEMLGIHIIGPRATELVAEATLALRMEMHRRGAHPDDPRAPDDVGGGGRSGARGARRGDSRLGKKQEARRAH